jgi:hypothetical protein
MCNKRGHASAKFHEQFTVTRQPTLQSLRGVNILSAVQGDTKHAGGRKNSYWSAIRRPSDS